MCTRQIWNFSLISKNLVVQMLMWTNTYGCTNKDRTRKINTHTHSTTLTSLNLTRKVLLLPLVVDVVVVVGTYLHNDYIYCSDETDWWWWYVSRRHIVLNAGEAIIVASHLHQFCRFVLCMPEWGEHNAKWQCKGNK